MIKRTGAYTIAFESQPVIAGWGSVVGKKEAEGPLKNYFDKIIYDSYDGCDTFEQAESMFQGEALEKALERSKTHANEVDCVFAGDLLNQCIGSSFGLMKFGIPYLGSTERVQQWRKVLLWRHLPLKAAVQKFPPVSPRHTLRRRNGSTVFRLNTAEFALQPHNGQLQVREAVF